MRYTMNIYNAAIGTNYIIKKINLDETVKRRFEILGMTESSVISVLNKKSSGAIINVRGTRLAIGKNFAKGISLKESAHLPCPLPP